MISLIHVDLSRLVTFFTQVNIYQVMFISVKDTYLYTLATQNLFIYFHYECP